MIQRIKKPEIKPKIKSPIHEKPLIGHKIKKNNDNKNIIKGDNDNNINGDNNIIVNMPQVAPVKKKKRKPKIANTAKQEFQDTLNE